MSTEADPVPGTWYMNIEAGQRFRVMSLDEGDGTVQIQDDDGNLDELQLSSWYGMNVEPAEPVLNVEAPTNDVSDGAVDYMANDPHAAHVPSEQDQYRRRNVEYAGKVGQNSPDPRPERSDDDKYERGSETGTEQWPETRERP